jgi:hypothetical protein
MEIESARGELQYARIVWFDDVYSESRPTGRAPAHQSARSNGGDLLSFPYCFEVLYANPEKRYNFEAAGICADLVFESSLEPRATEKKDVIRAKVEKSLTEQVHVCLRRAVRFIVQHCKDKAEKEAVKGQQPSPAEFAESLRRTLRYGNRALGLDIPEGIKSPRHRIV